MCVFLYSFVVSFATWTAYSIFRIVLVILVLYVEYVGLGKGFCEFLRFNDFYSSQPETKFTN